MAIPYQKAFDHVDAHKLNSIAGKFDSKFIHRQQPPSPLAAGTHNKHQLNEDHRSHHNGNRIDHGHGHGNGSYYSQHESHGNRRDNNHSLNHQKDFHQSTATSTHADSLHFSQLAPQSRTHSTRSALGGPAYSTAATDHSSLVSQQTFNPSSSYATQANTAFMPQQYRQMNDSTQMEPITLNSSRSYPATNPVLNENGVHNKNVSVSTSSLLLPADHSKQGTGQITQTATRSYQLPHAQTATLPMPVSARVSMTTPTAKVHIPSRFAEQETHTAVDTLGYPTYTNTHHVTTLSEPQHFRLLSEAEAQDARSGSTGAPKLVAKSNKRKNKRNAKARQAKKTCGCC